MLVSMTETLSLFFALLGFGGVIALVATLGLLAASKLANSSAARGLLDDIAPLGFALGAIVATTAMAGSLYYSEVANFNPCRLCWIQRFFMYPSAVILLVSLFGGQRLRRFGWLAVGLSVVGFGVAVYHRLEQQFPDSVGGTCALDNPCSGRYVDQFGFMTIPTMAAIAFALVFTFVSLSLRHSSSAASITQE